MLKKFSTLSMPVAEDPQRRERIDQRKRAVITALALGRLRESRAITQRELANTLSVSQANVSRIEHEEDLYISTLRSYIEALGGRLELRAVFEDASIDISEDGLQEHMMQRATRAIEESAAHPEIPTVASTEQGHDAGFTQS